MIISFPKYEILASDKDDPAENAKNSYKHHLCTIRLNAAQYFKKTTFSY